METIPTVLSDPFLSDQLPSAPTPELKPGQRVRLPDGSIGRIIGFYRTTSRPTVLVEPESGMSQRIDASALRLP